MKLITKRIIRIGTINIQCVRLVEEGQGTNLGRGTLDPNVIAVILTVTRKVFNVIHINCTRVFYKICA